MKMKTTIYIACKDGAAYNVPCKEAENGQVILVSTKDIPKNAYACFNDDVQMCMVEETGRFLDVIPEVELGGHWYFPEK